MNHLLPLARAVTSGSQEKAKEFEPEQKERWEVCVEFRVGCALIQLCQPLAAEVK